MQRREEEVPIAEIRSLEMIKKRWEDRRFKDMLRESQQAVTEDEPVAPKPMENSIPRAVEGRSSPLPIIRSSSAKIATVLTPPNSPNGRIAHPEELAAELEKLTTNYDVPKNYSLSMSDDEEDSSKKYGEVEDELSMSDDEEDNSKKYGTVENESFDFQDEANGAVFTLELDLPLANIAGRDSDEKIVQTSPGMRLS